MHRGESIPLINPQLTLDWLIANSTGKGVQVAVIDSGVDASHPELAGKVKRACVVRAMEDGKPLYEEIPAEQSYDSYGHGTAVSGIITSVAPDAEIVSIKVLSENNDCTGAALMAGIGWALKEKYRLINMSLATCENRYLAGLFRLCERAYVQQSILVASMHNREPIAYPAMFASVIGVEGGIFDSKYKYRFMPNSAIEYEANGTEVKVPWLHNGYERSSANSWATPHITGLVALLLEIFPDLLAVEAKSALKAMQVLD